MSATIFRRIAAAVVLAILLMLSTLVSCFAGEGFSLFPVPKLFISDDNVNREFSAFIMKNKQYGSSYFVEQLKKVFPESIASTIDNSNKYKSFVVSVQIPRASRYDINKPDGTVDIYLPITMSLYFTNILTGEVLYSYSYTNYSVYTAVASNVKAQTIDNLYRKNFEDLVATMLDRAKNDFKPFAVQSKAVSLWKGYVILDKGRNGGIATNDTLTDSASNQINIIFAGMGYSVGVPILGTPKEGAYFSKLSNQTTDSIKKPKVVILKVDNPSAFPEQSAQQFFSDSLGSAAQFSILPVQRNFYSIQDYVIRATSIDQKVRYERELPDYFIRINILPPSYVRYGTNKQYVNNDSYSITVFGELLDASGRVLYSADSTEKLEDQVVGSISFANEARIQVVVKNGLIGLAKKFAENVKFKHLELPVKKVTGETLTVEDAYNALAPGVSAKVFRNIGKVSGIKEEVLVPIWEVTATASDGSVAEVGKVLPTNIGAPDPDKGDLIVMDAVQAGAADRVHRVTMCPSCANLGGDGFDNCDIIASYAVSENTGYPFYSGRNFQSDVTKIVSDALFKKRTTRISVAEPSYCIEPVYKLTRGDASCSGQICHAKYSITAGLRVKQGGTQVFKKGMEHKVSLSAPTGYEPVAYGMELNRDIFNLFSDIAKSVQIGK